MTQRTTLIRITCEERDGGMMYVESPDIHFLHLLVERDRAQEILLTVIKDHFRLNHGKSVEVWMPEDLVSFLDGDALPQPCLPTHALVELSAV